MYTLIFFYYFCTRFTRANLLTLDITDASIVLHLLNRSFAQ